MLVGLVVELAWVTSAIMSFSLAETALIDAISDASWSITRMQMKVILATCIWPLSQLQSLAGASSKEELLLCLLCPPPPPHPTPTPSFSYLFLLLLLLLLLFLLLPLPLLPPASSIPLPPPPPFLPLLPPASSTPPLAAPPLLTVPAYCWVPSWRFLIGAGASWMSLGSTIGMLIAVGISVGSLAVAGQETSSVESPSNVPDAANVDDTCDDDAVAAAQHISSVCGDYGVEALLIFSSLTMVQVCVCVTVNMCVCVCVCVCVSVLDEMFESEKNHLIGTS